VNGGGPRAFKVGFWSSRGCFFSHVSHVQSLAEVRTLQAGGGGRISDLRSNAVFADVFDTDCTMGLFKEGVFGGLIELCGVRSYYKSEIKCQQSPVRN
jgi:hypothetical protein